MTLRTLGQSDLKITPIGIGAWAIGGGKWEFAWGPQDDQESIAAIHAEAPSPEATHSIDGWTTVWAGRRTSSPGSGSRARSRRCGCS